MSENPRFRLRSILRVARSHERDAQVEHAEAARRLHDAALDADDAAQRLADLDGLAPATVEDLQRHRARAKLRADAVSEAEARRAEMIADEWAAHTELVSAVRRRRSLERLEERHRAVQAGLATTAAQKALDELASLRQGRRGR